MKTEENATNGMGTKYSNNLRDHIHGMDINSLAMANFLILTN
jgi:hypothetical protein